MLNRIIGGFFEHIRCRLICGKCKYKLSVMRSYVNTITMHDYLVQYKIVVNMIYSLIPSLV